MRMILLLESYKRRKELRSSKMSMHNVMITIMDCNKASIGIDGGGSGTAAAWCLQSLQDSFTTSHWSLWGRDGGVFSLKLHNILLYSIDGDGEDEFDEVIII